MTQQMNMPPLNCNHDGVVPVTIGGFPVWLGAGRSLNGKVCLDEMDYIVTLNGNLPSDLFWGQTASIVYAELRDYGGVPDNWGAFIKKMADLIRSGQKVVAFCVGGHGRTGTFGASLIAEMEPDTEDPIAAIRERHCVKAVESMLQATAVFAIRGLPLPEKWDKVFAKPKYTPSLFAPSTYSQGTYKPFKWSRKTYAKPSAASLATMGQTVHEPAVEETFDEWFDIHRKNLMVPYQKDPNLKLVSPEDLESYVRRVYRLADLTETMPLRCEDMVELYPKEAPQECALCKENFNQGDMVIDDDEEYINGVLVTSLKSYICVPCYLGEGDTVICCGCSKEVKLIDTVAVGQFNLCKKCDEESEAKKCCNCQKDIKGKDFVTIDSDHEVYLCDTCSVTPSTGDGKGTPSDFPQAYSSTTTSGLLDDDADWVDGAINLAHGWNPNKFIC